MSWSRAAKRAKTKRLSGTRAKIGHPCDRSPGMPPSQVYKDTEK